MAEYFLIAFAVLVVIVIMMSVKIVSQGYRYTIERFGRFVRVATANGALAAAPPRRAITSG